MASDGARRRRLSNGSSGSTPGPRSAGIRSSVPASSWRAMPLSAGVPAGGFRRGGGGVLRLLLGAGLGLLHLQQALPVGDRDLVVVRVDLAERQEAVASAAVFHERRLEAGLHADHLGEVDVALELLLGGGLDVEILEPATVQHHHAGFFRVGGIDQHTLGH